MRTNVLRLEAFSGAVKLFGRVDRERQFERTSQEMTHLVGVVKEEEELHTTERQKISEGVNRRTKSKEASRQRYKQTFQGGRARY